MIHALHPTHPMARGTAQGETGATTGRISTANNRPLYRLSAETLFSRLDRDGSGTLTAADFVRISPAGARAAEAAHAKQNERAQRVFERLDADDDGQVSETEFKTALASMVPTESRGKAKGVAKFGGETPEAPPPPPPPPTPANEPLIEPALSPAATAAVQTYEDVAATS